MFCSAWWEIRHVGLELRGATTGIQGVALCVPIKIDVIAGYAKVIYSLIRACPVFLMFAPQRGSTLVASNENQRDSASENDRCTAFVAQITIFTYEVT